jgi:hypothetical protein
VRLHRRVGRQIHARKTPCSSSGPDEVIRQAERIEQLLQRTAARLPHHR